MKQKQEPKPEPRPEFKPEVAPSTKDLAIEACSNDIKAILEKYGCQIICQPQVAFGQTIYVPLVTLQR